MYLACSVEDMERKAFTTEHTESTETEDVRADREKRFLRQEQLVRVDMPG
jgi:hypothetical protein